jgi:hypothetical protein
VTTFLRLLSEAEKAAALAEVSSRERAGVSDARIIVLKSDAFDPVPGKPFAYWVSGPIREAFELNEAVEGVSRTIRVGLQTSDDPRFIRLFWEVHPQRADRWRPFSKGGAFAKFYGSIDLVVDWNPGQHIMWAIINPNIGKPKSNIWMLPETIRSYFGRPGITWSRRSQKGLSFRFLPAGAYFSDKGPTAFSGMNSSQELLVFAAIANSKAFEIFVSLQVSFGSYEAGSIQRTPYPTIDRQAALKLEQYARQAWSLKRNLYTVIETSHAFVLPETLRARLGDYDPCSIEIELDQIQSEIDTIAFDLYGFDEADRAALCASHGTADDFRSEASDGQEEGSDDEGSVVPFDETAGLLSWAVGVAFGRFDWRLATGEREAPAEPEPFDCLPTKSPGMLPDGADPLHAHAGILVEDEGHSHDLVYLLEDVLQRVDSPIQVDIRRWLQREFFPFHLQCYSKSRRKAPIYWPLSTLSGSYTLWLYYPDLTSQTLFAAVNEFIEPKLKQVRVDLDALRGRGSLRSKQEEKQLENITNLEKELADLRDAFLVIAPKYSPNHDDGVQIMAAPLWQLFRHKTWQKILKDTWEKLEHGEYDWSYLAINYWPERVLRKCHSDRSLAIAHDVENIFWHEVEVPVKVGKRSTGETKPAWEPKNLTDNELNALIEGCIKEKTA